MSQEITAHDPNHAGPLPLPTCSTVIAGLIETRLDHEDKPLPWNPPEIVTPALAQEAMNYADDLKWALNRAADREHVRKWLNSLGTLVAGQMPLAEAKTRVGHYATLMDFPNAVYTRETLKKAGERFKWFPSFAELSELLSGETQKLRDKAARAERLGKCLPDPKNGTRTLKDPDTLVHAAEMFEACRRAIAGAGNAIKNTDREI